MKHAKGFTLVELLIVIAIIGILASIGIPAYRDYVVRGKLVDASTQLADGRIKVEQYFQDNRTYVGWTCPSATKYFTFTCTLAATTYTLTAKNKANQGLGAVDGYIYTINESNAKSTTKFNGAAPSPGSGMLAHEEERLMLSFLPKSLGFSLIEMMVAIAIVAIAVVMGVPSYRIWIHNTEIRTAAESVQNGLQKARAEAVARNTNVAFALTGVSPDWASSWQVSAVTPATLIESRSGNDGSKKVTAKGYATNGTTVATSIIFNNLGVVTPTANVLRIVDFDTTLLAAGQSRRLRVTIGNSGAGSNIRMCDPNLATVPAHGHAKQR